MSYNSPVKCPDCGTWWRGQEHTCKDPYSKIGANPYKPWDPKDNGFKKKKPCEGCKCQKCEDDDIYKKSIMENPDFFPRWSDVVSRKYNAIDSDW